MTAELLSHPDRLLADHLAEVETVARGILARRGPGWLCGWGLDVPALVLDAARLHDLGKATGAFQAYVRDPAGFSGPPADKAHAPLSAVLSLSAPVPPATAAPDRYRLARYLVIRGHHAGVPSCVEIGSEVADLEGKDRLIRQVESLGGEAVSDLLGVDGPPGGAAALAVGARRELRRLRRQVEGLDPAEGLRLRLTVQAALSVLLRADRALLAVPSLDDLEESAGQDLAPDVVEEHARRAFGSPLRPLDVLRTRARRQAARDAADSDLATPTLRTLTVPTGMGKTLAAAAWALAWRTRLEASTGRRPPIVVALPYLALIEQTAMVWSELLGQPDERTLLVSHSLAARSYVAREAAEAEYFLDTWRSDVVVTTFDQVLLALADPATRHQQRFSHLTGAVLVLDEVQTLPTRLWDLAATQLSELAATAGTRVLLTTATQPGLLPDSTELARPAGDYFGAQDRYRLLFRSEPTDLDGLVDWLVRRQRREPVDKTLLVLNTRRSARRTHDALKDRWPAGPCLLLSADLVPRERLRRVRTIHRSSACLAVTTQCVEAGVDLDLHRVVRDLGPLDAVIQVAGRCNRHGLRPPGEVVVVDVRDGPGGRPLAGLVYDPVLLEATREVLPPDQPLREPEAAALGAPYFARLRQRRDLGRRVTEAYAAFRHGRREREEERMPPVRELLRGADLQHAFVVWETDPGLQAEVQQCLGLRERWERRRALRTLAGRAAAATVTVWPRPGFEPDAVAEEVGPFRFLRPGLYDPDTGLDQDLLWAEGGGR